MVSCVHVVRDQSETQSTDGDKRAVMNSIMHVHVVLVQNETQTGTGPALMRPEAFTVFEACFKKKYTKL